MNCAIHTDVPATAYCRTCGKPLCDQCKRDIHGVIYCQDCLAARVHDTVPVAAAGTAPAAAPVVLAQPVTGASPGLAGVLAALFPFGVGAVYNGQYAKGLVYLGIFVGLIYGTDHAGPLDFVFGIGIAFYYVFQIIDAVRVAKARQYGQPLPDDILGLNRLGGSGVAAENRPPVGAIVLLVLGVLFLLGNAGLWNWNWFDRFWPVLLIVVGIWLIYRRRLAPQEERHD